MAELADNILTQIKDESAAQNRVMASLLKQSKDQHLEIKAIHAADERVEKKRSEYDAQQAGIENQFAKVQQFLQEKTERGIQQQSETDTPGLFSDKDIASIRLDDDQEAIRVADIMGESKDKEISERLSDLQKKEEYAQEETKKREEEKAEEAKSEKSILKGILDAQLSTLGKTMGKWGAEGKERLQELASFDNFKGALKTDMNLMLGKLQLLTQLPGVTSILQGIKFVLAAILTFFISKGFGRALEPLIQGFEDFAIAFFGRTKESVTDAREAREKLYTAREKGEDVVEKGGKIKSAGGKEFDKDSPQGKMIYNMQKRTDDLAFKWQQAWVKTQVWMDNNMSETNKLIVKKIFGPIGRVFKSLAGAVGKAVRWLVPIITGFIVQVGLFIVQMGLLIGGFILANLPIIALVVAIGLLVFGIMWLVAYVITEWDNLKSKFNEEWDVAMMKWKNFSFSEWVDNAFQSFVLSVRNLWWSIASGIEGFINDAITWYNSKMPGDVFDIDWRADFGAGAKLEEVKKEQSALSTKTNEKAEDIAAKEKEIRDRYAAERGETSGSKTVQQNNVTNTNKDEKYISNGTGFSDPFAAAMNTPTY